MKEVKFEVTKEENQLIARAVERAAAKHVIQEYERMDLAMDLDAAHSNGCPLDFQKLIDFDDVDFVHDVAGIRMNLNRGDGKLMRFFLPRCARPAEGGQS